MADTLPLVLNPREWTALPDVDNWLLTNNTHHDLYLQVAAAAPTTILHSHKLLPNASANKISSGTNWVMSPQGGELSFTEIEGVGGTGGSGGVSVTDFNDLTTRVEQAEADIVDHEMRIAQIEADQLLEDNDEPFDLYAGRLATTATLPAAEEGHYFIASETGTIDGLDVIEGYAYRCTTDETPAGTAANWERYTVADDDTDLLNIHEILLEKTGVTPVDVFIYDTRKDSDCGAWRHRTQNTSWYQEDLNTATRGSRREMPSMPVAVAEASQVTIYDGDNPNMPMWKVNDYTGYVISSVVMKDGLLLIGTDSGLIVENFITGETETYTTTSTPSIVNDSVNDIAITVLDDAPIDQATGLPIPTIAVATDGGISVIKQDGGVVDLVSDNPLFESVVSVLFTSDGKIHFVNSFQGIADYGQNHIVDIPSADTTFDRLSPITALNGEFYYRVNTGYSPHLFLLPTISPGGGPSWSAWSENAIAGNTGLNLLSRNPSSPSEGMLNYITADYQSGWMVGDIKGAYLASTDTADLVADRSVNGNDLTVVGSPTLTPVATGAELLGFGGLNASNYLEQPYNADLDFGTGDYHVGGWFRASNAGQSLISRAVDGWSTFGQQRLQLQISGDGKIYYYGSLGSDTLFNTDSATYGDNVWHKYDLVRSNSVLSIYIDSLLKASGPNTEDQSIAGASLRIGNQHTVSPYPVAANKALIRISATAPTADQIAKIYHDERKLFQENAQCTIYGTSSNINDMDHDEVTDLLHVGTNQGRSSFDGLVRVDNTTEVTSVIAAHDGLIVEA